MQNNTTLGTKSQPLTVSSSATPVLDAAKKKHPFLMFFFEPIILLFGFTVTFALCFKPRLKKRHLRLKFHILTLRLRYLSFRLRCSRVRQGKLLSQHRND